MELAKDRVQWRLVLEVCKRNLMCIGPCIILITEE